MKTTFYFGRLNFKHPLSRLDDFVEGGSLDNVDRVERFTSILMEYMSTDEAVYEESDSTWHFGEVRQSEDFIVGEFGKVFKDHTEKYEDGKFVQDPDDTERAMASLFVIYPKKNLIIFNTRQRAGHSQFREAMIQGYNEFTGIDDGMEISLLTDTRDVEMVLERAARIFEAGFELVPTNPTSNPAMKELDDHIQAMGADELSLDVESESDSLNMEEPMLHAAKEMSDKGYGDYKIGYETEEGEEHWFDSRDEPATYPMARPENVQDLMDKAKDLIQRGRNLLKD